MVKPSFLSRAERLVMNLSGYQRREETTVTRWKCGGELLDPRLDRRNSSIPWRNSDTNRTGWWWLEHDLYFSIQLGIIIPIDFHIFQRCWNHQSENLKLAKLPGTIHRNCRMMSRSRFCSSHPQCVELDLDEGAACCPTLDSWKQLKSKEMHSRT